MKTCKTCGLNRICQNLHIKTFHCSCQDSDYVAWRPRRWAIVLRIAAVGLALVLAAIAAWWIGGMK